MSRMGRGTPSLLHLGTEIADQVASGAVVLMHLTSVAISGVRDPSVAQSALPESCKAQGMDRVYKE